jgi:phage terminase Nu1 subunit (DNA packaging protein)
MAKTKEAIKWDGLNTKQKMDFLRRVSGDMEQRNVLNLIKKSNKGKVLDEKEIEKINSYLNKDKDEIFSLDGVEKAIVDGNKLALILGITERRIQQLANEGVIQKASHGRYKFVQSIHEYVRYLQGRAIRAAKVRSVTFSERARKTNVEAQILELRLAERTGQLISIEDAAMIWQRILSRVRGQILSLPNKIPPYLLGITELPEIKAVIEKYIYEVMNELSEIPAEKFIGPLGGPDAGSGDNPGNPPADEATDEDDGGRVGG